MTGIENAKIKKAYIKISDYGGIQIGLVLEGGGWGVCFERIVKGHDRLETSITRILEIVGVNSWEQVEGKYIRAEFDKSLIIKIGNILNNDWFSWKDLYPEEGEL
jgi:hypothetical protein